MIEDTPSIASQTEVNRHLLESEWDVWTGVNVGLVCVNSLPFDVGFHEVL